jgi:hypothetical protein
VNKLLLECEERTVGQAIGDSIVRVAADSCNIAGVAIIVRASTMASFVVSDKKWQVRTVLEVIRHSMYRLPMILLAVNTSSDLMISPWI